MKKARTHTFGEKLQDRGDCELGVGGGGGEGGGHDGAAGWSGNTDAIAVESAFINILANTRRESK